MNFAQMLMAPFEIPYPEQPKKRRDNPNPDASLGWKVKMAKTEAKYRAAMGNEWMETREIERRLGLPSSAARSYLIRRLEEEKVGRRKVGPEDSWNRNKGYEWRWK